MTRDCDEIELLLADSAAGRLEVSESERVHSHVSSCASCQKSLEQLKLLRADLRSLPMPPLSERFGDRVSYQVRVRQEEAFNPGLRAWPWAAPAFSLAGLLGVSLVVLLGVKMGFLSPLPRPTAQFIEIQAENGKGLLTLRNVPQKGFEMAGPVADLKVLKKVLPDYPAWAQQQHYTGYVRVYFLTDTTGAVEPRVRVVRTTGYPDLDASAVHAIRQWKFSPAAFITTAWGIVTFQFPPSS